MSSVTDHALLAELHASLDQRRRPEDIAELVLRAEPGLTDRERELLERAAEHSGARRGYATSMSEDFARPVGGARQVAATARLFEVPEEASTVDGDRPDALMGFAARVGDEVGWLTGHGDFLDDRLDRAERAAAGIEVSKRQYNRRFRALRRLEAKAGTLRREQDKRRLTLLGRSGFAPCSPRWTASGSPSSSCTCPRSSASRPGVTACCSASARSAASREAPWRPASRA
ncbi:hypothetical protein GCM10020001_024190 [Nonomuraea salmonea]